MFHPWRRLSARTDLHRFWRAMAGGRAAATDGAEVIVMRPDGTQVSRRCNLTHELAHVELKHRNGCTPGEEQAARQLAARWLIDMDALLDAYRWAEHLQEVADVLWVDVDTLRARLDGLTGDEKTLLVDLYARTERGC